MNWFTSKSSEDNDGNITIDLFSGVQFPNNKERGKTDGHHHTVMTTRKDSDTAHVTYKREGARGTEPTVNEPSKPGYDVKK